MSVTDIRPSDAAAEKPHDEPTALDGGRRDATPVWKQVLAPLASLRLTVVLLSMGVFIVLVGTLAQAESGIEAVVRDYFRARPWEAPRFGLAWIPFQVFFPEAFFPTRPQVAGGFWFPGGWLIGLAMFANLLAAHLVRFTVQTRGARLWGGLGLIALGVGLTWLVVASGDLAGGGEQGTPLLEYGLLWRFFQATVVLAGLANVAAAAWLHGKAAAGGRKAAWLATAAAPVTVGLAVWAVAAGEISPSSMRILWQLIKATMAALVLLAGCRLAFRKRAGIVLLHAGVGLLMISELLVGLQAVETQMLIGEGETLHWAQDIRTVELAVVDPSDPKVDRVTAIPASRLAAGATLAHESFPFRVRIDRFLPNARLVAAPSDQPNPADAGTGKAFVAQETATVAGTDASGGVDYPAAYATVLDETGKPLGKYLLSAQASSVGATETVAAGGKEWGLALRFKRDYKPYSVTLLDVRKDDYVGTDTPRNYSSDVRVAAADGGASFERKIWMNNPLRYAGETLYQSGYNRDGSGREYTTLQVVKNTGWMLPYVSCMIVVVGMAAQFLVTLTRHLGRRAAAGLVPAADLADGVPRRSVWTWAFPALVLLVFVGYPLSKAKPPKVAPGEPDLVAFGSLPVASQGRVKPLDTLARDSLKALSDNRQTFADADGEKQPAIRWLADLIADPEKGGAHQVIRIDNDELLSVLELPADRKGFSYSLNEILPKLEALTKRAAQAREKSAKKESLTAADRRVLELERKIGVIDLLLRSFRPNVNELLAAGPGPQGFQAYLDRYRVFKHGDMTVLPTIPSRNPPLAVHYKGEWETLGHAELMEMIESVRAQQRQGGELRSQAGDPHASKIELASTKHEVDPSVDAWAEILAAYKAGKVGDFDRQVARYRRSLAEAAPPGYAAGKVRFESYFNHAAPFYYAMVPYLIAALLAACSWLGWSRPLNRAAFWLVVATFVLHTLALAGRIYISGRPPVTNLYSSAVFIGWAAVAFGIALERTFRLGFGNVLAGGIGFATLLVAHNLSADGDTFAVMQAVLDTQFWLATHVVCITLGYAATYVAGFLGLMYVLLGLTTPLLNRVLTTGGRVQSVGDALVRMTYGTLCFALLFSFFGTVLGGLWADDSWGRFWGWDPKENGALIIVLWNAVVLHARWGGMVKDRGLAVLAVAGNVAVSWSWFGTNELGVGLHSYGFTEGVLMALGLFVLSQLAVAAAGCLPKSLWRSTGRIAA